MISALKAFLFVVILSSITVLGAGDHPIAIFKILGVSAFGSWENLSYTLFYATPLLITGCAVQIALDAGLFNIGAEGQLYFGALGAMSWAALTPRLPGALSIAGGLICAIAAGGLWGALAGYLRAKRGTHEVIATIMLNFVALAFINWAILGPLKNPDIQYPETIWIAEAARLPRLWLRVTPGLPLAAILAAFFLWARKQTWWGYRLRAVGENEFAAERAGISRTQVRILAFAVSGAVAGIAGFHEVYCNSYRLIDGFSPGYGFTGLAIALIARGSFARMFFAALLFGALQKGALDLDIETEKITRDFSLVIQALVLFALAAQARLKEARA